MNRDGEIVGISDNLLTIAICREDACGGCGAKLICNASSGRIKRIECYTPNPAQYSVGDRVTIGIPDIFSTKAVLLAFAFPLVVLFATLFALEFLTACSDAIDAIVAICAVIVYYCVLYLFRDRIKRRFIFNIVKQQ